MKNKYIIFGVFILGLALTFSSCTKDLTITPINPSLYGNIGSSSTEIEQALAKVYASFVINGQGGSDAQGTGEDITTNNDDFNTMQRAMWNMQELTTDEAICAWGDAGISSLNSQSWTSSNPFLVALYDRLILTITYANSVINLTKGSTTQPLTYYNGEAHFLRDLSYFYAIDMFGNPPFITENSPIGDVYPMQISSKVAVSRPVLFNFIVNDLKANLGKMGAPGFMCPRADKAAAWMLLAKLYLNEQIYNPAVTTTNWDSCAMYCDSVQACGKYSLATNYRQNFGSNNYYTANPGAISPNPEMIFALACNGLYTQGSVGTTFMIQSCSSGDPYINAADLGLPGNSNWGGNRGKLQFMNELVDTLTYPIAYGTHADSIFSANPDQRIYLHLLADYQIYSATATYPNGVGEYKFTNNQVGAYSPGGVNDVQQAPYYNSTYSSTAYPIFRYADVFLMRAECEYNLGQTASAIADINVVRGRAMAPAITTLTDPLSILYERGREFYYEGQRRTDLVRFHQFVGGTYNWAWKGNTMLGGPSSTDFNIFPLPASELGTNPNITQNPGY